MKLLYRLSKERKQEFVIAIKTYIEKKHIPNKVAITDISFKSNKHIISIFIEAHKPGYLIGLNGEIAKDLCKYLHIVLEEKRTIHLDVVYTTIWNKYR